MQRRIPKPFTLLLFFFLLSNYLSASPDCPIVTARFPLADGTTSDPSATGWYLNATNVASTGYFKVKSNRLHAQELGGEGIWYSRVFSNPGYSEFQVAIKVSSEGDMNSSEYVKIYYKINGGAETLLEQRTGNFGTIDFISPVLTGNNVQLVVKIYNYNNGGSQTSKYYIEEYRMFKEKGPCTVSTGITVTTAAANGGILTCASPSLGLSATASGTGTTTWSWTGPDGFTSTAQNPTISAAGTYTVVATNSTGTGSASVTVTENKTAPVVTATGGALACGSCVTISATSNVSNATYSWSGPSGFTSNSQNPTVCAAGTYTVTVFNPANGCNAQQAVTVSASAITAFWLEDFTGLANGTTTDAGTTAWTSSSTGTTGTYSVQNNEFKITYTGQLVNTWSSQAIDISTKSNISFSVDLRSELASTNDAFETADYIRVYYKLNGGAETLVYEDFAGIGSTTNTTGSITFNSSTLSGSTLQVIIKASNSDPTERYFFDNIKVSGSNAGTTTVTPAVTGTVTCTSTAQLSATASGAVTAWAWTGPNGFTSALQNPVVNAGGQYVVTATLSSGCTVSSTITVAANKTAPDIMATGGSLACLPGITLNVNSSVSGATYSWAGPNGFTSTAKSPTVSTAGTYTATVTNPANGCTASQAVTVTAGGTTATFWSEDFTLANGTSSDAGTTAWSVATNPSTTLFSVLNNEIRISNSTTTGTGVWTSGVMNITGITNITLSAAVRSSIINNAVMNGTGDYADYIRFYYKLNNGAEVLFAEKLGIINNHSTTNTPISVSGLNGTSLQIVVRARATGNDEFYYFDNVQAIGTTLPSVNAVATATNILSCTNTSVALTGSSTTVGVSFNWTGPNNYTSTLQNPAVTTAGIYTLTVADPSTGCTGSDTALVSLNNTAPGASASASGALTCNTGSSATLSGTSATTGVHYSWTGPNDFTSTSQNPVVTIAGTYNLTVTNPVNGCTSTASAIVTSNNSLTSTWLEDFSLANGTTSDAGATAWTTSKTVSAAVIAVQNNELRITNCTPTGDVVWTSAALDMTGKTSISISAGVRSSIINNAVMNTDATYGDYIRFYYKLNNGNEILFAEKTAGINNHSTTPAPVSVTVPNGSYSTLQVIVRARATGNDEFYYFDNMQVVATGTSNITASATGGIINCINNSVTLQGSSATSGATYAWAGPDGYTSTVQNPAVTAPGTYTLTVAVGNCTGTASATVNIDTTKPNITASATPVQLTCTATPAILSGGSATQGVTYSWSNANGVIATTASTSVADPGTYTLTVNNPANGCTAAKQVIVTQNITPPPAITVSHLGRVTCDSPNAIVTGIVSTPGLNYSWSGPQGFTANTLTTAVTRGGTYTLTATDPANGCYTFASTVVEENTAKPSGLSITNPGSITCLIPSIPLSGFSITPNATYNWTGPNGYTSSLTQINVDKGGDYKLTVTDTINGCSASLTTTVVDNAQPPVVTIINTSPLTCSNRSVTLEVVTTISNPEILWVGPDFISVDKSTTTSVPGEYYVLIGNPGNGCSTTEFTTVTGDISECARKVTGAGNAQNTTSPNEAVTNFVYKAYPNPVITNGIIEFTSPQSATATVSIYNALGTCEKVLFKGTVMANRVNRVSVPAQQLSAGAYYYIINTGGKSFTGKLVIMK
jgi:trimeric autotransporter adhesin